MTFVDTLLVVIIIVLIVLLIWSMVMRQSMLDTLREIRIFLEELKTPVEE